MRKTCRLKYNLSGDYLACLPWYDDDSTCHNLDQLWNALAQFLRDNGVKNVPSALVRDRDLKSLWRSPQLLLGQCCGPDLFTADGVALSVIARPVFANLDCTPGAYYSRIVSRTERPCRPARLAVNSLSSRSGNSALLEWMNDHGIDTSSVQISGSHKNSLSMLDNNLADIVAIDAHTLNQLELPLKYPTIGRSSEAPAPPFVCHRDSGLNLDLLFGALEYAVNREGQAVGILDLVRSQRSDYSQYDMN